MLLPLHSEREQKQVEIKAQQLVARGHTQRTPWRGMGPHSVGVVIDGLAPRLVVRIPACNQSPARHQIEEVNLRILEVT